MLGPASTTIEFMEAAADRERLNWLAKQEDKVSFEHVEHSGSWIVKMGFYICIHRNLRDAIDTAMVADRRKRGEI